MRWSFFFVALLAITLSGCDLSASPTPSPSASPTQQAETIVQVGTITAKDLTIFEDGTHFLITDEGARFLLKSSIIDLSRFENERVEVTGETGADPSDELPVITVFAVDRIGPPADTRMSQFAEPEYGFRMELPGNWQRDQVQPEDTPVLQYFPEGDDPVIQVDKFDLRSPAGLAAQQEMTSGISVTVAGRQGWRLLVPGGGIDVFVPRRDAGVILVFRFTPGQYPEAQQATFYEMLSSIEWSDIQSASASPSPTTTPGETIYCGGVAKKLCPSGYRCEFTSLEENATGVCVDSSLPPSAISESLASPSPSPTAGGSPTATPTGSAAPVAAVPNDWKEYRNERMEYGFAVPVSWWWRHLTPQNGPALSRLEIAPEEVTAENRIATIEVFPGTRARRTETSALGVITISQPRDDSTYFEISGDVRYAEQIRRIASSLSSF